MLSRSKSRRVALQILYQREVTSEPIRRILALETYAPYIPFPPLNEGDDEEFEAVVPDEFTVYLVEGVESNVRDIDACLSGVSENWSLSRMPLVDVSILRIAAFEILYMPETPHGAAINEAIELAKLYGGDDSSKFINGILGKVSRNANEAVGGAVKEQKEEELT